jgi:uncharacterized Zn-binding protein involved in type VI secretion
MGSPLFHVGAQAMCPHAGQMSTISTNTRVLVSGQPVATAGDTYTIAGCPFTIPPATPQPCITAKWLVPALRVKVNGTPAVLSTSTGLCQSPAQVPQGPPTVIVTQMRVMAT